MNRNEMIFVFLTPIIIALIVSYAVVSTINMKKTLDKEDVFYVLEHCEWKRGVFNDYTYETCDDRCASSVASEICLTAFVTDFDRNLGIWECHWGLNDPTNETSLYGYNCLCC